MSGQESPTKQYLPIDVHDSPVNNQKGNLTGSPRIIQDSCADLYNYIQEWNGHHLSGHNIISKICDLKISSLKNGNKASNNLYPQGLQELCNQLETICDKLTAVVDEFKKICTHLEGVMKLNEMKNINAPVFYTWRIQEYVELSKKIFNMYNKELGVKIYIKENLGHAKSEETILLYQIIWVQQPFIESLDLQIEAILKETNLRQ